MLVGQINQGLNSLIDRSQQTLGLRPTKNIWAQRLKPNRLYTHISRNRLDDGHGIGASTFDHSDRTKCGNTNP
jgi:hypothetical protein